MSLTVPGPLMAPDGSPRHRDLLTVEDVVRYVKRYRRLALAVALPASIGLFVFLAGRTPFFRSETHMKVILEAENEMPFKQRAVADESTVFVINNHKVGLTTRAFQDYFFDRVDPEDRRAFVDDLGFRKPLPARIVGGLKDSVSGFQGWVSGLFSREDEPGTGFDGERDAFLKKWNEGALSISELKESHVIRITVAGPNRELVARLANQYAGLYADYLAYREREMAREAYEFLGAREKEYREMVVESRRALNEFRLANDVLDIEPGGASGGDEIRHLNEERAKIRVAFTEAESILLQVEKARNEGASLWTLADIASSRSVSEAHRKLSEVERQYLALQRLYGEQHRNVKTAKEEMEVLRQMIEEEMNQEVERLKNVRDSAEQKLEALERQLEGIVRRMASRDQKALELANLAARASSDQKTYDEILSKLNLAKVQMELPRTSAVRIIDRAVPGEEPFRPNKGVAAVMSGVAFMALFFGLPVGLGFGEDLIRRYGIRLPVLHRHLPEALATVPIVQASSNLELLSSAFSNSGVRESLFRIASSLTGAEDGDARQLVLVSSAHEKEGKSFISAALGGVFCSQGKKTLIVDAHLRHPSMSLWFPHLEDGPNLVGWLDNPEAQAFDIDYQQHGDSDLYVLKARGWAMNAGELLRQEKFCQLMLRIRQEFDVILLDGPAGLEGAEVGPLFECADTILLVQNPALSGHGDLCSAIANLDEPTRRKIAGRVVNGDEN